MKNLKVSLLALSVLAGGMMGAAAATATPDVGATYGVNLRFGTNAVGENTPLVFSVDQLPDPATNSISLEGFLQTDSAGKIEGIALLDFYFDTTGTNKVELVSESPT